MSGHRGEIELDGEVQAGLTRQIEELVVDLNRRRSGGQRDRLLDAHGVAVGMTRTFHDQRHAPGIALDSGKIGARHEITALNLAAGHQIIESHINGIKMINERLAGMPVVNEQPVEACLLEHHPVVDTRGTVARRPGAVF